MFKLVKKVDLSSFGWEGCVLEFAAPTYAEMKKYQEAASAQDTNTAAQDIMEMVESKFISGHAMNEKGEKVEVKRSDFAELPFEIVLHCITQLSGGQPDPNL